jgi:hypothetical protein
MTTQALIFRNPGEIDIRGATIAGLSAKDTENPIGFFGTGLKIAIASILRLGGTVTIFSGLTRHDFAAEAIDFRGQAFSQVVMTTTLPGDADGTPAVLGFTTEYGKTWEPWMIFREPYANMLDEEGTLTLGYGENPEAGFTTIIVRCPALMSPYHDRDAIILPPNFPAVHTDATCRVALQPANSIYYRGVRVRDVACLLTWNVLTALDITEDRTLKYGWRHKDTCSAATMKCTHEETIFRVIMAADGTYEASFEFPAYGDHSPEFLTVAMRCYKKAPRRHVRLKAFIEQHAPKLVEPAKVPLSKVQTMQLAKAVRLVAAMGVEVDGVDISVRDLGIDCLGQYHHGTDKVYLSPEVFSQGTKQVLSTLFEELTHRDTQKADLTYSMQTYLFNKIVDMYEEHVFGEPI